MKKPRKKPTYIVWWDIRSAVEQMTAAEAKPRLRVVQVIRGVTRQFDVSTRTVYRALRGSR